MTPLVPLGRRRPAASVLAAALLAVVVVTAVVVTAVGARAQSADERRLAQARAELEQIRDDLDAAEAQASTADAELEEADELLAEIEAVVNEVATAVEGQRAAVAQTEQRLQVLEDEREELVEAFSRRATRAFKNGPTQTWDLLLTGGDARDAMARGAYLRVILEGDQVDLEVLEASEVAVSAQRVRADAERERLEALLEEQQAILADAQELRESRALAAANARDEVRLLREEQDDLESEQAEIEELIEKRQAEERARRAAAREAAQRAPSGATSSGSTSSGRASAPSATSSAGYAWPMCAPTTSEYGPRWGRMHRGIDLGAGSGTPIGAVKGGTVIFANWQGGYGRLLLIDHGDGVVTAYAHMSSFRVGAGQSVQRGQTVGTVGSSGNSTGPHLHLEFRVNGRAVNPRQYLAGGPC